ncbi:MAG: HAD hydrolase family protein, partial [Rhizobiales bacterium]|nr:HAD hydrolase family protein [Hyphomicrobiales bacterium]
LRHADRVTSASLAQLVNVIAPIMTEPGGPAWRQTTFFPFSVTSALARGRTLELKLDGPAYDTALEKIMRDFAEAAGPAWVLQPGKMVFEIRPSRADKGEAVASYLEQPPFMGRLPIAIGDDLTDESMFALANARGGRSIRVGSLSTATCALAKSSSPSSIRSALATVAATNARKTAAAS